MIVRIEDIPSEGLELVFREEKKWWDTKKEAYMAVELACPVVAKLKLKLMGEKVHIIGEIHTKLKLFCARCLETFVFPLNTTMDFTLVPSNQLPKTETLRLKKEDLEVEFFNGAEIDLAQIVMGQIFLNIPMKPLCQPNCAGLCPYCGVNLNKEKCKCEKPKIRPFYEALKHLKL
ncbi:protein containing DUF177 [Candidatus Desulfofervidus auxilii]|uniref:Protein containing DUF177 n=1 Tax=Desulfofervidus auxilii TaxID=1621989 RepID=A0A7U4QLY3_DESA2|nr:DUF177 domain-containing protein [Candidatus Desulfofervidus auxilii]CAD7770391.1 MAG: putative ACR_ [Candidatus Methanoperedenaceae archaeon GB50]CAD7780940.1 putative ACR_ [Candidatus Methanoperedenaceae archaeon GB37]AMM41786.1 protein containing DUF177 [Candidatus Desulfofervidus auxilii]CAD7779635.1 putative ACR_ [Candidatus Methanoperedenaceae archaeon GB50]CAD7782939.1 MAG: putative ACR_ [Candidatus Methanoperedenaceae archaeon GB37]